MGVTTMNVNVINQSSFLQKSRRFPSNDVSELAFQVNITYVEIANAVNSRVISLFPTSRPSLTGEKWFIVSNRDQQSFRQVYIFTNTTSIDHDIDINNIDRFTCTYGNYTDGTNWYGLVASTPVPIAGTISFYITPTQIVFVVGAGAPALSRGNIVLQWLSRP
jgi:hypothetical protein